MKYVNCLMETYFTYKVDVKATGKTIICLTTTFHMPLCNGLPILQFYGCHCSLGVKDRQG